MKISNEMLNPCKSGKSRTTNNKIAHNIKMGLINHSNESNASPYIVKREILKKVSLFILAFFYF